MCLPDGAGTDEEYPKGSQKLKVEGRKSGSKVASQMSKARAFPFTCNPCPGYQCHRFEQPECILSVTVEQVIETIKNVLA